MTLRRTGPIRSKPSPNNPTAQQREAVFVRAGGCCERCGRGLFNCIPSWHAHHRQLRQSGNNGLDNLAALCPADHEVVHSLRLEVGEPEGFIVSRYAEPGAVPILHWRLGLVLLNDDGTYLEYLVAAPVGVPVDGPNDPSSALSVTVSLDQDRRSEQP